MGAKGKNYARHITVEQLDKLENPTLEDILALVNGGNYDKFFRDKPREFPDGSREYMTAKGAKAYGRLTCLLYAVHRCANMEDYSGGYSMDDVVEELDYIIKE